MLYDWANRLMQVKQGTIVQQDYFYDALNRRVQSKDHTGAVVAATEYVYHGSRVIEEYNDGFLDKAFVYPIKWTTIEELISPRLIHSAHFHVYFLYYNTVNGGV